MASTAIPAVKAALRTVLQGPDGKGAPGLEGVKVVVGREPERGKQYIWIWKGEAERENVVVGPQPAPLDEKVKVTLRLVVIGGEDPEADVFALLAAAELVLRQQVNRDLDGVAFSHRIEKVEEDGPLDFDSKVGWSVWATLTAKTRI